MRITSLLFVVSSVLLANANSLNAKHEIIARHAHEARETTQTPGWKREVDTAEWKRDLGETHDVAAVMRRADADTPGWREDVEESSLVQRRTPEAVAPNWRREPEPEPSPPGWKRSTEQSPGWKREEASQRRMLKKRGGGSPPGW
ncbi:hypothetical protein H0H93_016661 [Arthromyces matolae]|nr:hypothetical protein H0H93_016661 [Arthromyces matolae]